MKDRAGFPTDFRLKEIALIPIFWVLGVGSAGGMGETAGPGEVLGGRTALTVISETSLEASTPTSSRLAASNNSFSESLILNERRAKTLNSSG